MLCEDARIRALDEDAPQEVWSHIQGCGECRLAVEEARRGQAALAEGWAPSPGLEEKVVEAVRAERKSIPAVVAPARSRRKLGIGIAAAAAAATLAIVAAVALTSGPASTSHRIPMVGAGTASKASGTVTAIEESDSTLQIDLVASGLPRVPDPQYYKLWVITSDGRQLWPGMFTSVDGMVTMKAPIEWSQWKSCGVAWFGSSADQPTPVLVPGSAPSQP
jgi:anti-sigma-K factor RskA